MRSIESGQKNNDCHYSEPDFVILFFSARISYKIITIVT